MRKLNLVLALGIAGLCTGALVQEARACDEHKASAAAKASSTSIEKASLGACTKEASASTACAIKGSMASLFKEAPGTKTEFRKVENGMAFVVTAASEEYVPVVQKAVLASLESMNSHAGVIRKVSGACTYSASASASASCAAKSSSASLEKVSEARVEKASSGSSCCAKKAAARASLNDKAQTISAENCPEWMRVLCGSVCNVSKTASGITVTWTSDKPEQVLEVQAAGEQLLAEVNGL